MQFYKATGIIEDEDWEEKNGDRSFNHRKRLSVSRQTRLFCHKYRNEAFVTLSDASEIIAETLLILLQPIAPEPLLEEYLAALELSMKDVEMREISFREASAMLRQADRYDYIDDEDEALRMLDLDGLGSYRNNLEFGETVLDPAGRAEILCDVKKASADSTLLPELARIFRGKPAAHHGHPVHYLVRTDDPGVRSSIVRPLICALYENQRIRSLRYVYTDQRPGERLSRRALEQLYNSCEGGTVVIRYQANDDRDSDRATADRDTIEILCECMKEFRSRVLTILCLPRVSDKIKGIFLEYLGSVSLIELREDLVSGTKARNYLKNKVKEYDTRADRRLYDALEPEKEYLAADLNRIFEEWYNDKLKRSIYPQYRNCSSAVSEAVKKKEEGPAIEELREMIGLGSAKKVIGEALAYYKAQRLYADKGMPFGRAAMHMVFTGNPGTAKTTAARLFARIMRDNGLLSKGHLVEVGRSDLVGKYVGWTAPTVREKFKAARGGVLFIDEAYSLVDDRGGMYGDEAINTIVQEMENHRDDMVVIFAGYPDKMQGFLDRNPGLRSRIAFHVPFDDYSAEELCGITKLLAGKKKLELTQEALDKLDGIYREVLGQKDFGNGRFARNLLEKAQMAQAGRLLKMDPEKVTERDLRTIEAADIEPPVFGMKAPEKRKLGFC